MPQNTDDPGGEVRSRWYKVVLLGVITLAFVGFFVGTSEHGYRLDRHVPGGGGATADEETADREAPTYRELMTSGYDKSPESRESIAALRRRNRPQWQPATGTFGENRAYDTAPPTVPHPIQSRTTDACVTCHGQGIQVGDEKGPPMSHDYKVNCVQCHAPGTPDRPFAADPPSTVPTDNGFRGRETPGPVSGPRSYDGAPPRIPHTTQMRSNCAACHGPYGEPGPPSHGNEKASCRQCHAADEGPPVALAPPSGVSPANSFTGLEPPRNGGLRAWEGAPPHIPHQLHMRENCQSCHGVAGDPSIRTSHPERQNCVQCHAPTGADGFRPPTNLRPFP